MPAITDKSTIDEHESTLEMSKVESGDSPAHELEPMSKSSGPDPSNDTASEKSAELTASNDFPDGKTSGERSVE